MTAFVLTALVLTACAGDDVSTPPDGVSLADSAVAAIDAEPDAEIRGDAVSVDCPYICEAPLVPACTYDPVAMTCSCTCEVAP